MKIVGITAEYNPFHNGHAYHIKEARRITGADAVISVMSASFVQRGEPACADKFTRAKWAVECGSDMVIELPDLFSVSCAERFASGALRIMKGIGIIDSVCFGSETGDINALSDKAENKISEEEFDHEISKGVSYPRALAEADGSALSPNDILGVEYLRANKRFCCGFDMYAVKRSVGHDSLGSDGEFTSALAIRGLLNESTASMRISPSSFDTLARSLPRNVLNDISEEMRRGIVPAALEGLSDALLYRFRSMSLEDTAALPEVSEGLENLYKKYAEEACTADEMLRKVKSKRYTMARLKRIAVCGLLGITSELQTKAFTDDSALYARVLAVRGSSRDLLPMLIRNAKIPVIINAADREKLSPTAKRVESISALAHSVRALAAPYEKTSVPDSSHKLITV